MSNPWADSFDEYRQSIIGEGKGKKEPRWQDDDCDDKWYEKSDTDGKISKREKKEKAKHYVNAKEDITLTRGDYGSRNVPNSAWSTASKRGFKGYKAGGGLTPQFKLADEFQLEGNQRDPEGQEKDRKTSKQSDPSKDNFTGISGSIATIMKQNAAMKKAAKKKKVKEEVVTEKISASGYARAKKWREEQAREKDRKEQEHFRKKAQTHKWDGEKWNKREPSGEKNENVEINHIDGSKTEIVDVVRRPAMVAAPKFSDWKEEMEWQDEALKPDKLKIKEGGVKNKIEINPDVKTEGYASTKRKEVKKALKRDRPSLSSKERKKIASNVVKKKGDTSKSDDRYAYEEYDNTKSPDYEKKKKALAKKHGGKKNIKGHPQYEHHDIDEDVQSLVKKVLDRGTKFVNQNPVGKALSNVVKPWKASDGGSNRTSATAASQKAKGLRVAEQVEIEEKKKLSNCSPLIDRVSKWSKTMKKEEVISERDRIKYLKGGNKDALNQPPGKVIKHGVNGVNYNLVQNASNKTVTSSYEPEGEVIDEKKKGLDGKACWDGYKLAGTKKKGGKTVDNCVKSEDYYSGQGEKIQKRTLAGMRKKGQKGAPGLDAHRERIDSHKKKRNKKKGEEVDEGVFTTGAALTAAGLAAWKLHQGMKSANKIKQDAKSGNKNTLGGRLQNRTNQLNQMMNQSYEPEGEVIDEKKKKDDTYLETDFNKRLKNNEKARKDLRKGPQMKNPHLESIEVVVELNRYGKETGKATGSLNKRPGSPVAKGGSGKTAVNVVRNKIRKTETGKPEGQRKTRKKGEKTADMKGPSAKLQKNISNLQKKRALNKKAKDAGYKSTQDYVNVKARYPDK